MLASDSTLETIAITWLHVIREHPSFIKGYEDLFADLEATNLKKKWRYRLGLMRQLWRAFRSDGQAWFGQKAFHRPVDVVFISHLLNTSQAGSTKDFYFGDLPNRLQAAGLSVVVALIDHTGAANESLVNCWNSDSVPHVIFSGSMSLRREWQLQKRLRGESNRLTKYFRSLTVGLRSRVVARASVEALSGSTVATLRMHQQVKELVECSETRAIVVTYEGHAWERIAFSAAREVAPNILCAGYQHSAVFRLQHAIRRLLGAKFDPAEIFTAGSISKSQLDNSDSLKGLPVSILGSNRYAKTTVCSEISKRQSSCLVLPEGIDSECRLLFEFSLKCAEKYPDICFIWRLHPLLKFQDLSKNNHLLKSLPKNIDLSTMSMDHDLARADYALYRGSTAVVQALAAGLQPIYLHRNGEMTIDPLFELHGGAKNVVEPEDFLALVHKSQNPDAEFFEYQTTALKFARNFYAPLDATKLLAYLNQINGQ